jgi:hypothetical protein
VPASGEKIHSKCSLPAVAPGLPPVVINGEYYWDGGIVSNSPLWYVLENLPRERALVLQIDIFRADGDLPQDIDEVIRREKDIRLASRIPFNTDRIRKLAEMHCALKRLLAKLPASFKDDPDVQKLAPARDIGEMTIARLTNRGLSHAGHSKGYDFSRATVEELWATGLEDVRHSVASIGRMQPSKYGSIARVYELPSDDTLAAMPNFGSQPVEWEEEEEAPEPLPRSSRGGRSSRPRTESTQPNGEGNSRRASSYQRRQNRGRQVHSAR